MSSFNYEVVRIIDKTKNKLEYVKVNCEKMLSSIPDNMPVVILSVAGKTRIGKSFLINVLIDVFLWLENHGNFDGFSIEDLHFDRNGANSFRYASGDDSVTSGLHALCRPFIIDNPSNSREKMAIYLVDSQGLDALDQEGGVDQVLFALTNFLSSHIIFNISGNIKPKELLNLTVLANHSVAVDKENIPSLDIIVRDAKYTKSDINEMKEEYKQYQSLMLNNPDSNLYEDFERLKEYFRPDSVHVYPFPHPGRDVEYEEFKGDKKVIRECFIEIIHHYFVNSLNPKNLIPKFKNKQELLSIFGLMCDNILKQQKLGTDIFYEMITESHNNRLIFEFKEKHLFPLQEKCYQLGSDQFDVECRMCIEELEKVMKKLQGEYNSKHHIKETIKSQLEELLKKNISNEKRKEDMKMKQKELEGIRNNLQTISVYNEEYKRKQEKEKQIVKLLKQLEEKMNEKPNIIYHEEKLEFVQYYNKFL